MEIENCRMRPGDPSSEPCPFCAALAASAALAANLAASPRKEVEWAQERAMRVIDVPQDTGDCVMFAIGTLLGRSLEDVKEMRAEIADFMLHNETCKERILATPGAWSGIMDNIRALKLPGSGYEDLDNATNMEKAYYTYVKRTVVPMGAWGGDEVVAAAALKYGGTWNVLRCSPQADTEAWCYEDDAYGEGEPQHWVVWKNSHWNPILPPEMPEIGSL